MKAFFSWSFLCLTLLVVLWDVDSIVACCLARWIKYSIIGD